MIHEQVNFTKDSPEVVDGDILVECNVSQRVPDTEVFKGVKNLTVIGGNCVNCKFPEGTKFLGSYPGVRAPNISKNIYKEVIDGDKVHLEVDKCLGKQETLKAAYPEGKDRDTIIDAVAPQLKDTVLKAQYLKQCTVKEVVNG